MVRVGNAWSKLLFPYFTILYNFIRYLRIVKTTAIGGIKLTKWPSNLSLGATVPQAFKLESLASMKTNTI